MSALSPGTLKLALRLSDKYTVYVPLLFGGEFDDNNNRILGMERIIGMGFFRPSWNAQGTGERRITREIAGLCRTIVARHDRKAKLGVIGMCITGIIPLQVAGEKDPIPQLHGIVLSQPTMPMLALTHAQRNSLGISDAELERAKKHVAQGNLRILGFRFEKDPISPEERFTRLKAEFRAGFKDGTLKAENYGDTQVKAHAVLTDGYCDPETNKQKCAGNDAYRELRKYLKVALAE
jgi:dienelactone hydrolase